VHEPGRDVVEEQRQEARADRAEAVELGEQGGPIDRRRVLDREPGREREAHPHTHPLAERDELRELTQRVRRVRLAPARAVQRVVLRRVDVAVHAPATDALDQPEAVGVGPREPVEPLDHAAVPELHA